MKRDLGPVSRGRTGLSIALPETPTGRLELTASMTWHKGRAEKLVALPWIPTRTPQVVVARHLSARPSEISIVRPDVPWAVEEAVGRALAKVPADRFKSAREFADALVLGPPKTRKAGVRRRAALLVPGVILLAALSWMTWGWLFGVPLDPNRVVVFPLVSDRSEVRVGEGVASLLGWVLDDTAPLASAGYHEPSLVFLCGTRTILTTPEGAARHLAGQSDALAVVSGDLDPEFQAALAALNQMATLVETLHGLNYTKGRRMTLRLYARAAGGGQRAGIRCQNIE